MNYQHKFENTYLWGSYSPITGDSFVWEINGVDSKIFEHYLKALSEFKPREYKVVVIDNAAFHNTTNFEVPDNIYLLNIPAYSPELNPCEQIWQYIKKRYKNKTFEDMQELRQWLWDMVCKMQNDLIKSIVANKKYKKKLFIGYRSKVPTTIIKMLGTIKVYSKSSPFGYLTSFFFNQIKYF